LREKEQNIILREEPWKHLVAFSKIVNDETWSTLAILTTRIVEDNPRKNPGSNKANTMKTNHTLTNKTNP
jgi:hypothetical protein